VYKRQEEEITKERTVIMEEIKMYKDLPQSYVHDLLDELLWPGHPLGMSVIGSAESVARVDRTSLRLYRKRYYVPFNIVVSACGRLQFDSFTRKVKEAFPVSGSKAIPSFQKARGRQSGPQLKVFAKDTEQTHLALGFHGFRRDHPQRYALALLHIILGANMSSRLFNEVREKRGLAYEIGTQVKRFHDTGAFLVHAGIDNQKVTDAIRLILKELLKVRENLVSEGEFRRAKEFYMGQLMLALEDTLDHMLWIGESSITLDKAYTLEEIIAAVRTVRREDIRDVARQIFREESLNLALIGPLKDKEDKLRAQLRLG